MNAREYVAYDAVGLSELVQRGEVSALELADAAIERIEALNGRLNAVVETNYEAARLAARAADPARPLAGVPFLAKAMDTVVAGLRLTASCRWLSRLPAISVPLAQSPEGLPIGMQLIAPLGADALLLTVAAHLERELPWSPRLAALAASFV